MVSQFDFVPKANELDAIEDDARAMMERGEEPKNLYLYVPCFLWMLIKEGTLILRGRLMKTGSRRSYHDSQRDFTSTSKGD